MPNNMSQSFGNANLLLILLHKSLVLYIISGIAVMSSSSDGVQLEYGAYYKHPVPLPNEVKYPKPSGYKCNFGEMLEGL